MIKDLLLIVDRGTADTAIVDAACRLARRHDAHLTIAIASPVPVPAYATMGYPPFILLDGYEDELVAKEKSVRARASSDECSTAVTVVLQPLHSLLDQAGALTRYADVTVFGPRSTWGDGWLRRRIIESVLLGSGRPVLLLPDATIPSFARTLIGWNDSAEATRAVQAVLPLLAPDSDIVVGSVNPAPATEPAADDATPATAIATHLVRHGFRVTRAGTTSGAGKEAEALMRLAADKDADLMVVGAFGRSRLREVILGGVTEEMIERASVPVLLMH